MAVDKKQTESETAKLFRNRMDVFILSALNEKNGEGYGYDVITYLQEQTKGQFKVKTVSTIYNTLKRLENLGYITSYKGGSESNGAARVYYSLTDEGKDYLSNERREWRYIRTMLDNLVTDEPFDLEQEKPPYAASELKPITKRSRQETDEEEKEPAATNYTDYAEDALFDDDALHIEPQTDTAVDTVAREKLFSDAAASPAPLIHEPLTDAVPTDDPTRKKEAFDLLFAPKAEKSPEQIVSEKKSEESFSDNTSQNIPMFSVPQTVSMPDSFDREKELREKELQEKAQKLDDLLYGGSRNNESEESAISSSAEDSVIPEPVDVFTLESEESEMPTEIEKQDELLPYMEQFREKLQKDGYTLSTFEEKRKTNTIRYFFSNKINMMACLGGLLWLVVLSLALYLFKDIFAVTIEEIGGVLIGGAVVCLGFFFAYIAKPNKRKKDVVNLKTVNGVMCMLFLLLATVSLAVYLFIPQGYSLLSAPVYVPTIFGTVFPFSGMMYSVLYRSERFFLK